MATRADRRAERADRDTKVFPVGLHSQLRPELRTQFLDAVEQMLPDVNQILVELHLLLNYHFIRCIEEGVPLPDTLDSVVFNRACQAVSAAQGNCSQTAWRADLQLAAFFDLYEQECRPEGYQPAHRHNWYHNVISMECELARVNFMNHVATSVPDRTRMWLRMRLHSRRQAQAAAWAAQAAWFAAIPAAYQQPLVEQYWYRRTPTKAHNALMRLLYRACTAAAAPPLQQMIADLPDNAYLQQAPLPPAEVNYWQGVATEVRDSIGPLPLTDDGIRDAPCRYLPWLHRVLADVEAAHAQPPAQHPPNPAPQPPAGPPPHAHWQRGVHAFPLVPQCSNNARFVHLTTKGLWHLYVHFGLPEAGNLGNAAGTAFQQNKEEHWERLLDVHCLLRGGWHFDHFILTDGVALRVGAWRQRQPPPPAEPEEDPGAWVRGGPVPELPAGTRIAAVDPGRKSTFTAAVYETTAQPLWQQLQQVQAGVSGKGTHQVGPLAPWLPQPYGRPAGVEEPAPAGQAVHLPTVSWTAGKWYEEAGHNHRRRQQQRWLHQHPDLEAHLLATPSAKVANRAAFSLHARHRLLRLRETLDLFGRKRQRRLRWHSFMRRQQAMTRQVRAITAGSPDTVVAFGNARFRHYGPGCPAVPTVSLRRQLRLHCRYFEVDEYNTSKLCCACHEPMRGFRPRGPLRVPRSYRVRLCTNTECYRTHWNRDTNAAIAMLVLFMHWAAGMDKPAAYVRPQQQQPAPPDEPPPPVPPPLPGELAEGPLAWEDEDD